MTIAAGRRPSVVLLVPLLACVVATLSWRAAPTLARGSHGACVPSQGAGAHRKRACTGSARSTRAHGKVEGRHGRSVVHSKRKRKTRHGASGAAPVPAPQPAPGAGAEWSEASCDDGSSPTPAGGGAYSCEDGSAPECEDGSRPTPAEEGSLLMCAVPPGASPTAGAASGDGESEGVGTDGERSSVHVAISS